MHIPIPAYQTEKEDEKKICFLEESTYLLEKDQIGKQTVWLILNRKRNNWCN